MPIQILNEDHELLPFDTVIMALKKDIGLNVEMFIIVFRANVMVADIHSNYMNYIDAWRYVEYAMDNYNLHDALMMTSPYYVETYVILCNMKYDALNDLP